MMLSVISSHYKREENKQRLIDTFNSYRSKYKIELIIEEGTEHFNTGLLHNVAVAKASGKWILKQDIDCTFDKYDEVIEYMEKNNPAFLNIGCLYPDKPNDRFWNNYGNEYCLLRSVWDEIGGEPQWLGYGYEDYGFEAKILEYFKLLPDIKFTRENCTNVWRDEVSRKMNLIHNFRMIHWPHDRVINQNEIIINRARFFNLLCGVYGR